MRATLVFLSSSVAKVMFCFFRASMASFAWALVFWADAKTPTAGIPIPIPSKTRRTIITKIIFLLFPPLGSFIYLLILENIEGLFEGALISSFWNPSMYKYYQLQT